MDGISGSVGKEQDAGQGVESAIHGIEMAKWLSILELNGSAGDRTRG
jgi:hypothetical protein